MNDDMDTELTPEEREAFRLLPREAMPSDLLEGRVMRDLRARRLLSSRRFPWYRGTRLASGVAASVILFLGGAVFGQWLAGRTSAEALSAAREIRRMDTGLAAIQVQQTGSAYVAALASLNAQRKTGTTKIERRQEDAFIQGWEAALSGLHAATEELARMDPHDRRIAQALEALQEMPTVEPGTAGSSAETRQVLWF